MQAVGYLADADTGAPERSIFSETDTFPQVHSENKLIFEMRKPHKEKATVSESQQVTNRLHPQHFR